MAWWQRRGNRSWDDTWWSQQGGSWNDPSWSQQGWSRSTRQPRQERQERHPDVPANMVIICKWPVLISDYPGKQELHSWSSIFDFCRDELAVHCKLHGRKRKGSALPGELALKGSNVNEGFKHVWAESKKAGINLSKVPMAAPILEDDLEDNEEAPTPTESVKWSETSGLELDPEEEPGVVVPTEVGKVDKKEADVENVDVVVLLDVAKVEKGSRFPCWKRGRGCARPC